MCYLIHKKDYQKQNQIQIKYHMLQKCMLNAMFIRSSIVCLFSQLSTFRSLKRNVLSVWCPFMYKTKSTVENADYYVIRECVFVCVYINCILRLICTKKEKMVMRTSERSLIQHSNIFVLCIEDCWPEYRANFVKAVCVTQLVGTISNILFMYTVMRNIYLEIDFNPKTQTRLFYRTWMPGRSKLLNCMFNLGYLNGVGPSLIVSVSMHWCV